MKQSLKGWMLFCILSTSLYLCSQTATTSLRGTVKDPSGALVPGTKISLTDNANGQKLQHALPTAQAFMSSRRFLLRNTRSRRRRRGSAPKAKVAELLVNQPAKLISL